MSVARRRRDRVYLAAGGLALVLIFAGDRAGWPRLQALGAAILGVGLASVGVEAVRDRYFEMGVDPGRISSSSRFAFRGPGAVSFGLLCVTIGLAMLAVAAVFLTGAEEAAWRLVAARPGVVLAPLGFLFLCSAGGWLWGEERMNSSLLMVLATLPQRLGALVTVLFSLAVLAVGLFELFEPAAFDRIVESLKPPPLPPLPER